MSQSDRKRKIRQYLFFKQWHSLKDYCQEKGVHLFGDLAIYVSFDSADVWANPDLFKLDRKKDLPLSRASLPTISVRQGSCGATLFIVGVFSKKATTSGGENGLLITLSFLTS